MSISVKAVTNYLEGLQQKICTGLSDVDGQIFITDRWQHENGHGCTRVLSDGVVIEKGAILFSHVEGKELPKAATEKRPDLIGKSYQAMGLSLVIHPLNPYAPTSHMNVRFFISGVDSNHPVWWFGGGYDLTPYYGFAEDAKHWHEVAHTACQPFGADCYTSYKKRCDEYFYLPHREEARGIGGVFFDDLNEPDFKTCFAFMQSVGSSYLDAYLPILKRRMNYDYQKSHRDWQLLRRGRYVEFNLVHDRGTLFGLQSGGRTESILASMPPKVSWAYRASPTAGSEEQRLLKEFLPPRDWLK